MAWTSPSTWVAGAALTAAQLNQQLRDNLKAIGDPWVAYTPIWTAATTNPVIGNGTLNGAYVLAGKYCTVRIVIGMGSTTTYGSGAYSLTLPFAPSATPIVFAGMVWTGSAINSFPAWGVASAASTALTLVCDPATAGTSWRAVTATVPVALANTHALHFQGTYQVS